MKWMFVTSDYLYIDEGSEEIKDQIRHASYSLLKTLPSMEFADLFTAYRSGRVSPEDFTDRIVESESFENFVSSFSKQWLRFSEISQNAPDRVKYAPFYDDDLEVEFQKETTSYIKYLFTENRKLTELIKSDYHFINDKLAVLYGIENVRHNEVRKVDADDANDRMGILSHGGFMAATSNGVEDMPFRRAKWISENILDKVIPPPPDEIDVTAFGKAESQDFASRIEAHIVSESCQDCHKLLDGLAIDIHMFDGLGRLKEKDFSDEEVRSHLMSLTGKVSSSDRGIASAFTKNLITFINGRRPGIGDLQVVDTILNENKETGYRARDILRDVIAHFFEVVPQ